MGPVGLSVAGLRALLHPLHVVAGARFKHPLNQFWGHRRRGSGWVLDRSADLPKPARSG